MDFGHGHHHQVQGCLIPHAQAINVGSKSTTDAAAAVGVVPTTAPGPQPRPGPQPSALIDFPTVGSADVAVFWDFENVRIPAWCPATTAAEGIRSKVAKYGRIVEKRLYYDSRQPAELSVPRSDLDLSGFTLVDCPSRGRKETLDKKLIVDVLCFAWQRASTGAKACVVLITSDGDYSYTLARLRDIGVFTIIIYRPDVVANVLIDNANVVMSWEFDVLGGPPASHGEEDFEDEESAHLSIKPSAANATDDGAESAAEYHSLPAMQLDQQTRGKFALFCNVVLTAQYSNVRQGIDVYSSWAEASKAAVIFYNKIGEKDREAHLEIRALATKRGFVEWGRRDLTALGRPVIKVKDNYSRSEGLSAELYLRLTHSGLSVVKPDIASKESNWKILPRKGDDFPAADDDIPATDEAASSPRKSSILPPAAGFPHTKAPTGGLFVGGLAWETTEDSLRSYFRQFGPIKQVRVKEGGGFGFVFFHNPNDAAAALSRADSHVVDRKALQ